MKLLLVEDHPVFRLGMREVVRQYWPDAVVCESGSMADARSVLESHRLDVIVLDLGLPDATGAETAARILAMAPATPVLVVSCSSDAALASRLLKLGVRGFVPKEHAGAVLAQAITRVLAGGRYITPDLADKLIGQLATKSATLLPHETMSPQEYRVMLLIAEGRPAADIAQAMSLSVKTIGTYRARVLSKAAWKNNTELTKYCIQHRLTDLQ